MSKTKPRGNGRRFEKGKSGNPKGRPPLPPDVRKEARARTAKCIKRLDELLDDDDPKIRLLAIEKLLERGWGKPVVVMGGEGGEGDPNLNIGLRVIERVIVDPKADADAAPSS